MQRAPVVAFRPMQEMLRHSVEAIRAEEDWHEIPA